MCRTKPAKIILSFDVTVSIIIYLMSMNRNLCEMFRHNWYRDVGDKMTPESEELGAEMRLLIELRQ